MIILLFLLILFFILWLRGKQKLKAQSDSLAEQTAESEALKRELEKFKFQTESLRTNLNQANLQINALKKYQGIVDIETEIKNLQLKSEKEIQIERNAAQHEIDIAKQEAKAFREKAKLAQITAEETATLKVTSADKEAKRIIANAETKAKEIAGDAYEIAGKVKELEKAARAMKNTIEGYGDEYLKPTYSLLDDLAEDFGYAEAGQQLKLARENSARMVKLGTAARCEYVEENRKKTAIAFVIDAFNGKVDSILSKTKKDNFGKLEEKIKDAYNLVNYNGRAFRNAEVTPEYLSARLEELKWAVRASELKARVHEEQRQIREQMREEEKARKEYERAMKEAAKEEDLIRKAMEKAQKQIETATEAKRAEYESKLEELRQKLKEAEERGQRAMSMAQQTRHGNVYVISNIGSFGENVYKVGMTRRLDPMDRVRELGDASVPFPFDVHAIIESDDAPALENSLHKDLSLMQMNKVNPRKEFFRVSLADIRNLVEQRNLSTNWTITADATEYRETLAIEKAMKNDPDAKHEWEKFVAAVSTENEHQSAGVI